MQRVIKVRGDILILLYAGVAGIVEKSQKAIFQGPLYSETTSLEHYLFETGIRIEKNPSLSLYCFRVTIQDLLPRSSLRAYPRTMPEQNALTNPPESPDDELKRLRERVAEKAAIIGGANGDH